MELKYHIERVKGMWCVIEEDDGFEYIYCTCSTLEDAKAACKEAREEYEETGRSELDLLKWG